ncbi:unnamed protein product [Boreogadus saida]
MELWRICGNTERLRDATAKLQGHLGVSKTLARLWFRHTDPVTAVQNDPEILDNEYDDTQDDRPAADMSYDTPGVADSLPLDCDYVHHSTVMVSDNDLDPTGGRLNRDMEEKELVDRDCLLLPRHQRLGSGQR